MRGDGVTESRFIRLSYSVLRDTRIRGAVFLILRQYVYKVQVAWQQVIIIIIIGKFWT